MPTLLGLEYCPSRYGTCGLVKGQHGYNLLWSSSLMIPTMSCSSTLEGTYSASSSSEKKNGSGCIVCEGVVGREALVTKKYSFRNIPELLHNVIGCDRDLPTAMKV